MILRPAPIPKILWKESNQKKRSQKNKGDRGKPERNITRARRRGRRGRHPLEPLCIDAADAKQTEFPMVKTTKKPRRCLLPSCATFVALFALSRPANRSALLGCCFCFVFFLRLQNEEENPGFTVFLFFFYDDYLFIHFFQASSAALLFSLSSTCAGVSNRNNEPWERGIFDQLFLTHTHTHTHSVSVSLAIRFSSLNSFFFPKN